MSARARRAALLLMAAATLSPASEGPPRLSLVEARSTRSERKFLVKGTVQQDGSSTGLAIPLAVETLAGRRVYLLEVDGASTPFTLQVDALPVEIRLDPDLQVPRHPTPVEIDAHGSRRLLVEDLTGGDGGITSAALMNHIRMLGSSGIAGRAPFIEDLLKAAGTAPGSTVAPFMEGYKHSFTLSWPELDSTADVAPALQVRRASSVLGFEARPFPFVSPAPDTGFQDEVFFLGPEDLAHLARAPIPPDIEGGIIITVERAFTSEADSPPAGPLDLDPLAAAMLADQVLGAARAGASALVIARPTEGPSVYEPWLACLSSSGCGDPPAYHLPFAGPPPELLVLSVGPELGAELLGRHTFARYSAPPTLLKEPGFNPILLDLEVSASAPLKRKSLEMANLIGYLEGSDPNMKDEVVLLSAPYEAAAPAAGVASLIETARLFSDKARRPPRSLLLAALAGKEASLAGSRALTARLEEMPVRLVSAVSIESTGSKGASRAIVAPGPHCAQIRWLVMELAPSLGLVPDTDLEVAPCDSDSEEASSSTESAVQFTLTDSDPALLERTARLAALTAWAMAN